MAISCVDGEIGDFELATWEAAPLQTRVALTCAQVRAVFLGSPLARGIALLELRQAQIVKLFPTTSKKKNALSLRRWAARLSSERVRVALASATWHQIRVAARHDDEEAQIGAAIAHALGIR